MKTLKEVDTVDRCVLLRCDFNVPLDKKGKILDDFRIKKSLPTINYLIENRARIVLMSHLGDPAGKVVKELKMDAVAKRLSEYVNVPVIKVDDCIGPDIESQAKNLEAGNILVLENLRFHKEETDNDEQFAKKLSYLGEAYINDAFGVCHRNNASITGITKFLPACMGLLLEKELQTLDKVMRNPEKPMIAIVGGTKVETKAKFINNISEVADFIIVSGLIAKEIKEKKTELSHPEKILAPKGDLAALDINEESIKLITKKIMEAKTVLWNGPFGKFEQKKYEKGTLSIAKAIVESGAFSVVGGGETVEFLNKHGMIDKFSHVSTGGGAMLSYLSGETLPGIEALG